jgi:probable addiction module antidote protein
MAIETTKWDTADFIHDEEDVIVFLTNAFEEGDPAYIAHVLGAVARSKGVTEIARKAGVSRETIYSSLTKDGDPRLSTLTGVFSAMGLVLSVHRCEATEAA